jgi:exosortase/archaeosortase family protein
MTRVGVVEACSGLSMLLLFFAISTGVAMLVRRPLLDKLVLVASAIPIALLVNIARIVTTGVLNENLGEKIGQFVYHDLAGWLMMPLAILLASLEMWALDRLFPEAEPRLQPAPLVVHETVGSR